MKTTLPKFRLYSLGLLLKSAAQLIGRRPFGFLMLTVVLMANEHSMEQLRWMFPQNAWMLDLLCLVMWPAYFVVTILLARYAHFGLEGLRFPPGNVGRAMRYLAGPLTPILLWMLPAYIVGVPVLNPLVAVAFALLSATWMWSFTPLSILFHSLSSQRASDLTRKLRRRGGGLGLPTILGLLGGTCILMLLMERTAWVAFIGPLAFVMTVTSVYCAYTFAAESKVPVAA